MPFKFNATRRHRIPRAHYRVRNWPAYEAGLRQRGDLTLWIDEVALDGWRAPRRNTPGGQAIYSDLAIEMVLMLRMVFHLALRQAEAFARSVLRLLGLDLCVPDHSTLSRRSGEFARRRPNVTSHGARLRMFWVLLQPAPVLLFSALPLTRRGRDTHRYQVCEGHGLLP